MSEFWDDFSSNDCDYCGLSSLEGWDIILQGSLIV
jgi:hypothetical protein